MSETVDPRRDCPLKFDEPNLFGPKSERKHIRVGVWVA